MENTGATNGAGKKKKPTKVIEVDEQVINEHIDKFTADRDPITGKIVEDGNNKNNGFNVNCGLFETQELNKDLVNSDSNGTGTGNQGNPNIIMAEGEYITQSSDILKGAGVYIKVIPPKEKDKGKDNKGKEERNDNNDERNEDTEK